jgi:hypothetical protein
MQKFLQIHYILLVHPSFYLIYRNQKAQAVSSTVKKVSVFFTSIFDNFGQWEDELIQHDSTVVLLGHASSDLFWHLYRASCQ